MNFVVVGPGESYWSRIDEFVALYNQKSVPVYEIQRKLHLGPKQYLNLLHFCVEQGLVVSRRKLRQKPKKAPKNYNFNRRHQKFHVRRKGKHYGSFKTEKESKIAVKILKEHDWNLTNTEVYELVDKELGR